MNIIRLARVQPQPAVFSQSSSSSLTPHKTPLISSSFRPIITASSSSSSNQAQSMDQKDKDPKQKPVDLMSDSFGEGYATRSNDEGFGAIYGENDENIKTDHHHENHPGYDKTQGSEVKEKEKARHQT